MNKLNSGEETILRKQFLARTENLLKMVRLSKDADVVVGFQLALLVRTGIHLYQDKFLDHLTRFLIETQRRDLNRCRFCGDEIPLTAPSEQELCAACEAALQAEAREALEYAKEAREGSTN